MQVFYFRKGSECNYQCFREYTSGSYYIAMRRAKALLHWSFSGFLVECLGLCLIYTQLQPKISQACPIPK